jgi:hypothetical protein
MEEKNIQPGKCYEAKKPVPYGFYEWMNDRMVLWISSDRREVQYDAPGIKVGRHYPTTTMTAFLKWAGRDVTALMPEHGWRKKPLSGQAHPELFEEGT